MLVPLRSKRPVKQPDNMQHPHRSTLAPIMPHFSVSTPSFNLRPDRGVPDIPIKKT